ncbi:MAG: guanylate kinase [Kiritimatiellae bacterium]|nr:guanylate kinase [Kiritimatiellia bacterium]MDD4735045.1 guanylate kinase [Kiritimatiellia bacterium]
MNTNLQSPVWMVVSAPSGAGKTTLCNCLLQEYPDIHYSVSCTTRRARPGEQDGVDYHFMDVSAFEAKVAHDAFLEHAEVHGACYGTLKESVFGQLIRGVDVLMDIDVQGAAQIRRFIQSDECPDVMKRAYVDVFITPPSIEALHERLILRGADDADVIERRVNKARDEMESRCDYDYIVVNGDVETAYDHLRSIYVATHWRTYETTGKK